MKKILNNMTHFRVWFLKGLNDLKNYNCLCVNLYDDEDEGVYSCELVGTNKFCKDGSDWNFDEEKVYSRKNPFILCNKTEIDDDTKVLLLCKTLIETILSDKKISQITKDKSLAFGFVNGKMYFVNLEDGKDQYRYMD